VSAADIETRWARCRGRALCADCGEGILVDNVVGLHTHSGTPHERWRRAMAASVGGVLVTDLEEALDAAQAGE
jgi:hypothetical protein